MTITEALYHLLEHFTGFIVEITDMNFNINAGTKKRFHYSENLDSIETENMTIQDVKTFTIQKPEEGDEATYITVTFADNTDVRLFCI